MENFSKILIDLKTFPIEFWYIFIILIGLCVGSFLNVVIFRIPKIMEYNWFQECKEFLNKDYGKNLFKISLSFPQSFCPNCNHKIKFYENIPVLSYIFLKGKCSQCKQAISLRYPFVEMLTATLSFACIYYLGLNLKGLTAIIFIWFLIVLSFIDMDTQFLPDNLIQPLLWLGLIFNLNSIFVPLPQAVIGAVLGYISLYFCFYFTNQLTEEENINFDEAKLLSAIGAWLGWKMIIPIVLIASFCLIVISIFLIFFLKKNIYLSFASFLSLTSIFILFSGNFFLFFN